MHVVGLLACQSLANELPKESTLPVRSATFMDAQPVDVTLYTRRECPLCDKAKEAMRASGINIRIEEIDIDNDPELRRRYKNDIPVVCIGNAEIFRHRTTPEEFARLVREHQPAGA